MCQQGNRQQRWWRILNVDNRYQTVTVSSTTGVVAGDAFTIDGIEAVHHITKRSTGELKTFRVIEVVTALRWLSARRSSPQLLHLLMLKFSIRT
jgi:hypothetical protein